MMTTDTLSLIFSKLKEADIFDGIEQQDNLIIGQAADADATYELEFAEDGSVSLYLRTEDRWLSESIEADLMHTGDSMEELIEDELVEIDDPQRPTVKHYRDEGKRYTFETEPENNEPQSIINLTLAFEAAFSQLGDMGGEE